MCKYRKKSNRNSYPEEDLVLALEEVKKGKSIKSAAEEFNVPRTTLGRKFNESLRQKPINTTKAGYQRTFSDNEEKALVLFITEMQSRLMGFTSKNIRKLAFDYAERYNIKHNFNTVSKSAGKDWLKNFMSRHGLSFRKAEHTSKSRAYGFNRSSVNEFFDLLQSVMNQPSQIYNVDETGVTVNPKSTSYIISKRGIKQVGGLTALERGETVTAELCMSADGRFMPPMLIFPRVKKNPEYLAGAPSGAWAEFNKSGWINEELFANWMVKFIEFSGATKNHPVLLLLDGHSSHVKNLKVLLLAQDNGVYMINYPPHTSHKLQALDVSFMKPLNDRVKHEINEWLALGKTPQTKNLFQIFGKAWQEAACMTTALNGFKKTGVVPYNRHIFKDTDFATDKREAPIEAECDSEVQKCLDSLKNVHAEAAAEKLKAINSVTSQLPVLNESLNNNKEISNNGDYKAAICDKLVKLKSFVSEVLDEVIYDLGGSNYQKQSEQAIPVKESVNNIKSSFNNVSKISVKQNCDENKPKAPKRSRKGKAVLLTDQQYINEITIQENIKNLKKEAQEKSKKIKEEKAKLTLLQPKVISKNVDNTTKPKILSVQHTNIPPMNKQISNIKPGLGVKRMKKEAKSSVINKTTSISDYFLDYPSAGNQQVVCDQSNEKIYLNNGQILSLLPISNSGIINQPVTYKIMDQEEECEDSTLCENIVQMENCIYSSITDENYHNYQDYYYQSM